MKLDIQTLKQLRRIMADNKWESMETAIDQYAKENFIQGSVKRINEFETIWNCAEVEGGKRHLLQFFRELEEAVKSLND